MATHISSVKDSSISIVSKDEFWSSLREGQILFCAGRAGISRAIEACTDSPWSHVAMVVKIYGEWCLLEAVFPRGVAITPIWRYIDGYDGDLVLTKRVVDGIDVDETPAIVKGIREYISRGYAAAGLVKEELHRLLPALPPEMNGEDIFCSGLQWLTSQATPHPFPSSSKGGAPTPEDLWVDPSVIPVCAQLFPAAQAAAAH